MGGRHTVRPQPAEGPGAAHLVAAGAQLINELVRQLQTRATETDDPATEQLTRRIRRLKKRIRALEDCVVFLASAVGTCAACFGKMEDCLMCQGRGQPGKLTVDQAAYADVVAPLFEQQPHRLKELVGKHAWADPATVSQTVVPGLDQQPDPAHAPHHDAHFSSGNGEYRRLDMREGQRHGR